MLEYDSQLPGAGSNAHPTVAVAPSAADPPDGVGALPQGAESRPAPGDRSDTGDPERDALWERFDRAPASRKERARRRAEICRTVEDLARVRGWMQAYAAVAARTGIPVPTVRRWSEKARRVGRQDLAAAMLDRPKAAAPRATAYDPRLDQAFREFYLRLTRPAAAAAWEKAVAVVTGLSIEEARAAGWKIPRVINVLRKLRREMHPDAILLAREGRDALDRKYPSQRRDRSGFYATQAVNADGHRWDFAVEWPDGEIARPMTVAVQDLYSNVFLGWRTDRSENRDAVRLAFADTLRVGIPEHIYFDNGRAFMSKWMTAGMRFRYRFQVREEDPIGIFRLLGIEVHATTPYHGQSKPIERAFGDLEMHMRARPELAGAWLGNSPAAKPEDHGERAVELAVFLRVMDEEIVRYNRRRGRRTDIAAGRSFQDVFDESYARSPIRRATAAQLRLCLLAAERVYVRPQDATIHLFGNRYWSNETAARPGEYLVARFDPGRLESPEAIHLYLPSGEYLGQAEARVVAGFNDADAAQTFSREKRRYNRAVREALAAERRMDDLALAREIPPIAGTAIPGARVVRPIRPALETRKRPAPPREHPDRARLDASYDEITRERRARLDASYDESADIDAALNEYRELAERAGSWSAEDAARAAELEDLPEVRAYLRRRA